MPYFKQNPLQGLALQPDDIEDEIDLRGCSLGPALARLTRALDGKLGSARRFAVRIDPPRGDGTRTLFQPIGRFLLEARRDGRVARCLPLADSVGFYLELPAQPQPPSSIER